jgi:Raf kinase inhibitor-like YbhB/YbcL family protein
MTVRVAAFAVALLSAFAGCAGATSSASSSVGEPTATADVVSGAPASVPGSAPASAVGSSSLAPSAAGSAVPFTLTSSAFRDGQAIPRDLTCDGANTSPPLAWTGVPAGAAALVLVVDDPDANGFVHWLVLDLPAADGGLPGAVSPTAAKPQQGTNTFGKTGWDGPCPPSGTHHYRFVLTALTAPLALAGHPGPKAVADALAAATSNVVGEAQLTGTYHRG